jgi:hypothetical protein
MTKSHNRPERERLPRFKAGISVVKKVKLTVVTGASERLREHKKVGAQAALWARIPGKTALHSTDRRLVSSCAGRSEFGKNAFGGVIGGGTIGLHARPRDVVRLPVQGRPARH